ncbi:MAG TPA: isocitrate lyase/phosphoenolpyruvate mutase family protein, partial [Paracoccus sp. (in: a-proteobacteria)]|nr:isocitrate lyase/phosphoenolpyruvate mutase family protein [Paracoccus sp. (in: a-proteobacteria)]
MTPLRKRLETGAILAAPGAPDALSAHLGFEAVYMTGLGATASRYAECGVDLVFADCIKTRAEVTAVAARVPGPKVVSLADGTDAATVTLDDLQEMGFSICLYAATTLFAGLAAQRRALETLRAAGHVAAIPDAAGG